MSKSKETKLEKLFQFMETKSHEDSMRHMTADETTDQGEKHTQRTSV